MCVCVKGEDETFFDLTAYSYFIQNEQQIESERETTTTVKTTVTTTRVKREFAIIKIKAKANT